MRICKNKKKNFFCFAIKNSENKKWVINKNARQPQKIDFLTKILKWTIFPHSINTDGKKIVRKFVIEKKLIMWKMCEKNHIFVESAANICNKEMGL